MRLAVDRHDIQAFLATLPPDPERDRRADALRSAATSFESILGRKAALTTRLEELAVALADATGKDRETLLTERGVVATELGTLPVTVRVIAGRFADALSAWGAYTYCQVEADHNAAVDEIDARENHRQSLVRKLIFFDGNTQYADQRPPVQAAYDALQAELRPFFARRDPARTVCHAIQGDLKRRFGDAVRVRSVGQQDIDRFVTMVSKRAA